MPAMLTEQGVTNPLCIIAVWSPGLVAMVLDCSRSRLWLVAQPFRRIPGITLCLLLLWLHRNVMFKRNEGLTTVAPDAAR